MEVIHSENVKFRKINKEQSIQVERLSLNVREKLKIGLWFIRSSMVYIVIILVSLMLFYMFLAKFVIDGYISGVFSGCFFSLVLLAIASFVNKRE